MFFCSDKYISDLKEYTSEIIEQSGSSSPSAERELICLADSGNTVACKLYADLIFYNKLKRRDPYREAFRLYLISAGLKQEGSSLESFTEDAYPLSYWIIGYYLMNYRRESVLKDCTEIPVIESMELETRLGTALELAFSCLSYVRAPGAVNLIGRILQEAGEDPELLRRLLPVIRDCLKNNTFSALSPDPSSCDTPEGCLETSTLFFKTAAAEGYVYACNNLAIREADRLIDLYNLDPEKHIDMEYVKKYTDYLKLSADKYEPYAANRLGLFYMTGEIRGSKGAISCKSNIDPALSKEYFMKATLHPDRNSAWAYFNLIKFFHKDYVKDIELLNEHLDCIKELDQNIHDLAMEL